jgi:Holliday junction resolvase RusA-like endonuclease
MKVAFTILGEPPGKANSRQIALVGPKDKKHLLVRKGDKALAYEESGIQQIPPKCRLRLEGDVKVTMRIWYASRRPDLVEDLLLDMLQDRTKLDKRLGRRVLLQAGVYRNDRQVAWKDIRRMGIDPKNPRTEVEIETIGEQQVDMLGDAEREAADAAMDF